MLSFRFQKHLSLILALCFLMAGLFAGCSKGEKESSVDSSSSEVSASQSTENSGSFLLAHGFDFTTVETHTVLLGVAEEVEHLAVGHEESAVADIRAARDL